MGVNTVKTVNEKLTKGLLDIVILQFLSFQPMHGYQMITKIRRNFGVYLGPSTVYPLLNALEKQNYVESNWCVSGDRPRKVYKITNKGRDLLNFTKDSLALICQKIGTEGAREATSEAEIVSEENNSKLKFHVHI